MIDLTRNPKLLTESWMKMFGAWNKTLLKYIYGKDVDMIANLNEDQSLNFVIRGEVQDVRAYANAIIAEKEYLETYAAKGKDHPMTNQKQYRISSSHYLDLKKSIIRFLPDLHESCVKIHISPKYVSK